MQARSLPFSRGPAWLREGFQLWRRNPALLTFLSFGYLMLVLLTSAVPLLGQIIVALAMPGLSLGMFNGCRAIANGRKAGPELLFSGFRMNLPALVMIGGLNFLATFAVLGLTAAADGGVLFGLMTGARVAESELQSPGFTFALLIATTLSTPLVMAYWFAPLLAGWQNLPAAKAFFFSFIACYRNWRPFLAYSLALLLYGALLPGLLVGIVSIFSPTLGDLLALPLPLLLVPIVFASFYVNAMDVFASLDSPDAGQDG